VDQKSLDKRFQLMVIGVAIFLLLDTLLLAPVLVVAFLTPQLLWAALTSYLTISVGLLVAGLYTLHRWGLLKLHGAASRALVSLLGIIGALTALFIVVAIIWPAWVWATLPLYIVSLGYAVYRRMRWATKALAFHCQGCAETFRGDFWTWILGPNFGARKYVRCPRCGQHTWAEIVDAPALPSA